METIVTKKCTKCRQEKPLSDFYHSKNSEPFRICKLCHKAKSKAWKDNNREKVRTRDRVYKKTNPDKVNEQAKRYYQKHRERILSISKELRAARKANARAKKRGNNGNIVVREWKDVLKKYGDRCLYPGCGSTDITLDHVIPLALGGSNTAENMQPLCKYHNVKKNARYVDYRPTLDFLRKPEVQRQNGC